MCVDADIRRVVLFALMVVRSSISHAPARQHLLVTVAWTALRIFYSRKRAQDQCGLTTLVHNLGR